MRTSLKVLPQPACLIWRPTAPPRDWVGCYTSERAFLLPCRFRGKPGDVRLVLHLMRLLSKRPLQPLQPAGSAAVSNVSRRKQLLERFPGSVLGPARAAENKAALEHFRRASESVGEPLPRNQLGGIVICFGELLNRLKEEGGPREIKVSAVLVRQSKQCPVLIHFDANKVFVLELESAGR